MHEDAAAPSEPGRAEPLAGDAPAARPALARAAAADARAAPVPPELRPLPPAASGANGDGSHGA